MMTTQTDKPKGSPTVPPLTDFQVVERAETLIKRADVKAYLPRGYTLSQLWTASKMVHQAAMEHLEAYGDRLEQLAPVSHRELSSWKEIGF